MKLYFTNTISPFRYIILILFFIYSHQTAKADPFEISFGPATYTNGSQIDTFSIHCGDLITLPPGGSLTFDVSSYSLSISNVMILSSGPLPPGATFPTVTGMTYVKSTFNWTPIGSFVGNIIFQLRGTASVDCPVSFDWVLPVELASFTSFIFENNVTLNWKTYSEINNLKFVIEKSKTTNESSTEWTQSGTVPGNGTTSSPSDYTFSDMNLNSGIYQYRLKQIDYNGNFEYHYLRNNVKIGLPDMFELSQNYPNPFNPRTIINYELGITNDVKLIVYDVLGNEVATLVNENKPAGRYEIEFDGNGFASGNYYYKLEAGEFADTKQMVLLK